MKKRIIQLTKCLAITLITISVVLSPFITLVMIGTLSDSVYLNTYLGALSDKYERLKHTSGKRIVFIGGSSTAFGLRSDLIEQELPEYKVVNFGLYGTIGTNAMISLSKVNIHADDLIVLMPEVSQQSMSIYFNPETMLQCLDSNWEMFNYFSKNEKLKMAGHYLSFLENKLDYLNNKKTLNLSGVYQRINVNEYGDIAYFSRNENGNIIYDSSGNPLSLRQFNTMPGLVDKTSYIRFSSDFFSGEFVNLVNDYNDYIKTKHANLVFAFSPVNAGSLLSNESEIIDYYWKSREVFHFRTIGNPFNHIFEPEYFYDSNFHLNDSGAIYNTINTINELKQYLGIRTETNIQIPEKPIEQGGQEDPSGGPQTQNMFEYEDYLDYKGNKIGLTICGVDKNHLNDASLSLPWAKDEYIILSIKKGSFSNTTNLKTVRLNKTLQSIDSGAFSGCDVLENIVVPEEMNPDDCFVPYDIETDETNSMLYGCNKNVKILVPKSKLGAYQVHYNWSRYRDHLSAY